VWIESVTNSVAFSGFVVKNNVAIKNNLLDVSYVERCLIFFLNCQTYDEAQESLWSLFKSFHFLKVTEDLQENQQVLRCDILLQYPGLAIYEQKCTRSVAETGRRRPETV